MFFSKQCNCSSNNPVSVIMLQYYQYINYYRHCMYEFVYVIDVESDVNELFTVVYC